MRRYLLAVFLLISLLLANPAFAEQQQPIFGISIDFTSTLGTILTNYIGIVFILVFILILLIIGGVIHLPAMGGTSIITLIIFGILLLLAFVFPNFITFPDYASVPSNFKYYPLPGPAVEVLGMMGLPKEWGYVPAIIYLFVLPFAAIYTLFWAFLTSLGIFNQPNINRMLALIVTFLTIPIGWFTRMVWALFAFMGGWSVAIFAVMFIGGLFFRGAGVIAREYSVYSTYSRAKRDADKFQDHADSLIHQFQEAGKPEAVSALKSARIELVSQVGSGLLTRHAAEVQISKIASQYAKH
jgi:hypothetical protein